MASSNRPHTPGTGAGVRGSQSESNYISWTWDHLFFQENGAPSQVSVHLGFCFSFNTALSSVTTFWGQTFPKAGLCTETQGTAAACHGTAWRQLPPSPLEMSEPHSPSCQLWALYFTGFFQHFLFCFRSSTFRLQRRKAVVPMKPLLLHPSKTDAFSNALDYSAHSCSKETRTQSSCHSH